MWETLATDFRFVPQPETNTHAGFQAALEGAKDEIDEALDRCRRSGKPLFIAGHSLGGALERFPIRLTCIRHEPGMQHIPLERRT
jgi:surfactin synthase thioesterase subunit